MGSVPSPKPKKKMEHCLEALELFLVLSLAGWSYARFQGDFTLTIFQARDLARAELVAAGQPIFFGSEMSGGGLLPGGFYYWLLAVPIALGADLLGVRAFQLGLLAISVVLGWRFVRRHLGFYPALFGLACVLPSLHPERQHKFAFLNPGFLPLFFVAALICLCHAFAGAREKSRSSSWMAFCALAGLGGQIHFSALMLLLPGIALQLCSRRVKMEALSRRAFAGGLLLFLFTLLPHLLWLGLRYFSLPLGQQPFPNAGSARIDLGFAPTSALQSYSIGPESWTEGLLRLFWLVPLELLLAAAVALLAAFFGRPRSEPSVFLSRGWKVLAVVCLFFLPQALYFVVAKIFYRYTFGFTAAVQMLTVFLLAWAATRIPAAVFGALATTAAFALGARELGQQYNGPAAFFVAWAAAGIAWLAWAYGREKTSFAPARFLAIALVAVPFLIPNILSPFSVDKGGKRPDFEAQKKISEVISAQTGWPYEEARQRIFYVNTHNESSLAHIYQEAARAPAKVSAPGLPRVDGYFVVMLPEFNPALFEHAALRDLLARSPLEPSLLPALRGGQLALGKAVPHKNMAIVPYQVRDLSLLPPYFHNRSDGYSEENVWRKPPPLAGSRVSSAELHNCDRYLELCRALVSVEHRARGGTQREFQITLRSQGLSQASDWISPKWVEAWLNPYMAVTCAGKERRVALARSVGFNPKQERFQQSASFLAPFHRLLTLPCAGEPEKILFGFEGSVVSRGGGIFFELPAKQFILVP